MILWSLLTGICDTIQIQRITRRIICEALAETLREVEK